MVSRYIFAKYNKIILKRRNLKIEFYMKLSRNEKEFLNKVTAYIKWGGVVTFLEMNIYWQG